METIESMLKNCTIKNNPKILIYIEGDGNDGDCIGEFIETDLTPENLDYYRAILYIYTRCFNTSHWIYSNPFSKYGIGSEYALYDDDDEDDDQHSAEDNDMNSEENSIERMKLELIFDFIMNNLPSDEYGKCHSVKNLTIYIISPQNSGELEWDDISDEEIARVWKANH